MATPTFNTIAAILAQDFHVPPAQLRADDVLDHLGLDRRERLELMFAVEDAFRLRIPGHRLDPREPGITLQQVCDAVDLDIDTVAESTLSLQIPEGATMSQKFQVSGMSCSHCVSAVQNAVQAIDPKAQVTVDLETGHVDVMSTQPRQDIVLAIENAGYRVE
ncbi:cation transporter [Variovorax soli]|uniref:Copper chaperone CopZ/acyl carrier protein n=1 Tax=Variovorax soli TaxID=376815 RepID=A0ABU1N9F3_9BURK|nr:copper chaperone CopZ/acyl carrier protein [Variovorax soli]